MRAGMLATARLAAWTALLLVLARVTLVLGSGPLDVPLTSLPALRRWLDETAPADMAAALLRLAALAAIAYLLAATALVVVSRLVRARGLTAFAQRVTPGLVRRVAAGGGGLGLALGTVVGTVPAPHVLGGDPPPGPQTVVAPADRPTRATMTHLADGAAGPPSATMTRLGDLTPDTATMSRDGPLAERSLPGPGSGSPPLAARSAEFARDRRAPPVGAPGGSTWVVEPGDSFWSIAADVVTPPGGRPPGDRVIGRYWRRLIEANRSQLVDRDNPDLLVPGQRLTLPPVGR